MYRKYLLRTAMKVFSPLEVLNSHYCLLLVLVQIHCAFESRFRFHHCETSFQIFFWKSTSKVYFCACVVQKSLFAKIVVHVLAPRRKKKIDDLSRQIDIFAKRAHTQKESLKRFIDRIPQTFYFPRSPLEGERNIESKNIVQIYVQNVELYTGTLYKLENVFL